MLCCSPDRCHTFYVSRMPSQCCVLSYKAVPFLHSARATVASLGPPPRLPPGPRAPGPARACCAPPAAPAAARGRRGSGARSGGGAGEEGTGGGAAGRGRGAGARDSRLGGNQRKPRHRGSRMHRSRPTRTPPGPLALHARGATARSCVKARQKRHISTTEIPSPAAAFGSGPVLHLLLFRAYGSAVTGLWSRAHTSTSHIHIALRALSHWQSL